jgi:hypothetical protein
MVAIKHRGRTPCAVIGWAAASPATGRGNDRASSGLLTRDGPITSVIELLEQQGVVVMRLPLSTADVDAFSLSFADHPVVVLGSEKRSCPVAIRLHDTPICVTETAECVQALDQPFESRPRHLRMRYYRGPH